jgi:hypothetical protein
MDISPAPPRPDCPEKGIILLYLSGVLDRHDWENVDDHLSSCAECRAVKADLVIGKVIRTSMGQGGLHPMNHFPL